MVDVRALLDGYQPTTAKERRDHAAMVELAEIGAAACARDNYLPGHFTASAFVLDRTRAELLLIMHAKLGRWLQPGGHIEPDDVDAIAAARREVAEEAGLSSLALAQTSIFDIDVHDIPPHHGAPAHRHYDLRFLFTTVDKNVAAMSDASDVRWVPIREVSQLQSDESVMRAVKRLLV